MNFIDSYLSPVVALDKSYHLWWALLSVIVASITSYVAFGIVEQVRVSTTKMNQWRWLAFGSVSMGVGLWSMHFIALLSLQLALPVDFKISISAYSFFPALLASMVILWLATHETLSRSKLLLGGFLLTSFIHLLHYFGLLMMELNADVVHLKPLFFLSIMTSVALSVVALKIKVDASNQDQYCFIESTQLLSALMMGGALSCMYYVTTQTVIFIPFDDVKRVIVGSYKPIILGIVVAVAWVVLGSALIIPYLFRFRQRVQKNEQELKVADIAFQTHEAIMVMDKTFKITKVNRSFIQNTGYDEDEVIGKTATFLNKKYDENWFQNTVKPIIKTEGIWSGSVENQRKKGGIYSEWQTISAVTDKEGEVTHYVCFFADIKETKITDNEIGKLAFYDPLTELPNRRLLDERLNHELKIARRYLRAGVLLYLDLDRFRDINTSLGHAAGDQVLIETGKRLQSLLRDTDTAVRLGGDEFVVLSSAQDGIDANLTEHSKAIAEKIIQVILQPYLIEGRELFLSASIGVTLYTGIDETVDSLLKRADAAMYQAKAAGRNTYRFYQQSMQDVVDVKLNIERNLGMAISQDELTLCYQPQHVDKKTMVGVEALLRWDSSNLGQIPPAKFIPIAEETGLILTIGQWVIEKVCEQMIDWDQQGIHIPHVSINISAKQFHQADFAANLDYIVSGYNIKPERIMLEVTESIFLGKFEDVNDKMHVLKKKGFKFSIDDFGSGNSSLTYLKRLPFDQLKVDQSVVREFINQPTDVAIVKAIVSMAKGLNMDLIAEGVETKEHFDFLLGFGCDSYQGDYFSRPLSVKQLDEHMGSLT